MAAAGDWEAVERCVKENGFKARAMGRSFGGIDARWNEISARSMKAQECGG